MGREVIGWRGLGRRGEKEVGKAGLGSVFTSEKWDGPSVERIKYEKYDRSNGLVRPSWGLNIIYSVFFIGLDLIIRPNHVFLHPPFRKRIVMMLANLNKTASF